MITGLLMLAEAEVEGNLERSMIGNEMLTQVKKQYDGDLNHVPMDEGLNYEIAEFPMAKNEDKEDVAQRIKRGIMKKEGSITPLLWKETKNRRRRSFSYKSICIPETTKKCTMITYGGVTKPYCLYVKKNICYGLD